MMGLDLQQGHGWKRLAQNAASLSALQAFQMLMPLLLIPFLARALGPQAWAQWALADSMARYVSQVIEYGFALSATRAIARAPTGEAGRLSAGVLGAQALLAAVTLPAAALLIWLLPWQGTPLMWSLACLWAVFQGLNPTWFLVGTERAWALLWIESPVRLTILAGVWFTVTGPQDAWRYFAWLAAGGAFIAASGWALVWLQARPLRFSLRGSLNMLRSGAPIFAFRSAVGLYTTANVLLLGVFASGAAVAAFAGAEKIARAVISLIAPVCQAFYPRISGTLKQDMDEAARTARVSTAVTTSLGFALGSALWATAPLAVRLVLGPGFDDAAMLLRWLSPLVPLVAAGNALGIQWMLPLRLDKEFTVIVLTAGLTNLAAVSSLAPHFGAIGSVWSAVLAEFAVAAGCWWTLSSRRLTPWTAFAKRAEGAGA